MCVRWQTSRRPESHPCPGLSPGTRGPASSRPTRGPPGALGALHTPWLCNLGRLYQTHTHRKADQLSSQNRNPRPESGSKTPRPSGVVTNGDHIRCRPRSPRGAGAVPPGGHGHTHVRAHAGTHSPRPPPPHTHTPWLKLAPLKGATRRPPAKAAALSAGTPGPGAKSSRIAPVHFVGGVPLPQKDSSALPTGIAKQQDLVHTISSATQTHRFGHKWENGLCFTEYFSLWNAAPVLKAMSKQMLLPLCLPIASVASPVRAAPSPRHRRRLLTGRLIPATAPRIPFSLPAGGTFQTCEHPPLLPADLVHPVAPRRPCPPTHTHQACHCPRAFAFAELCQASSPCLLAQQVQRDPRATPVQPEEAGPQA